ncbi:DUF5610 domain-containing protein [Glaciecola petra]|uniref:DUF5610 domain-containing protein n=1 Tax=Glaciecola petra TaxID=3075602 RepID=A0ABU2ZWW8_9ALTE|nr:DUF5610 domain-containing protein [Aestuariibacter sp. P117]MDT0596513.1 DUF5610 domain-containing protein [Aestuariibacter sp. P117]
MNTLQTQNILSSKAVGEPSNNGIRQSQLVDKPASNIASADDTYSASHQSDAVIAKVVSFSLKKNVGVSVGVPSTINTEKNLNERFDVEKGASSFEAGIDKITANVVSFVGKALHNLASQNYSEEQLNFYRNEAIKGVEVGIDQAKIELIGLADENTFDSIDQIKNAILQGVDRLSLDNIISNASATDTSNSNEAYNEIDITLSDYSRGSLSFDNVLIKSEVSASTKSNEKNFTTSSSGISFSINVAESKISSIQMKHEYELGQVDRLANLVNQTDALLDSFYRGSVEDSYAKSQLEGYSDEHLLRSAKAIVNSSTNLKNDLPESPKQVADYLSKYLGVIDSSKQILEDEQDFNQIINGLVNQMKDVQVPDLLQAINKFHSFNRKFD